MAESQLRTLYESLRRDNYDVPGTYESFERTLTAPGKEGVTNRQTLYNSLHADGYDVPDTYESFANTLFVPQPKQQTAPAPQAVAEAPAPAQKTQAAGKATAPVQKAQPQVRAQTRPTSQQPAGTVAAFKLRRGGHDFYVTQQEVNEAGGLGAWAAKHPGAPVRVYMHGDGFTGHVDLSEASKRRKEKGYKYTLEYRPGHKVKRNKSGWVDNLVEYGQEAKAIEEMTAPTKQVVEQLWSAAEKKQTTDARNNYDALNNKWSRTGDDMPFVDSSVRYLANETDRMKNFDLDKMSEEAWRRSGAALTQKVYQRLKLANPKTDDSKLIEQAEAEAWRLTNKAVYDYAVEKNMPKSVLEYFFKKVMDQNSVVSLLRGTARSMAGTTGDRGAYEAAQEEYGKKHKVASVAGTVVGMGADPMMTLTGGAGGAAGKAVLNVGGRLIAKKTAGTAVETGTRLFANKLGAKVAAGVASGSVNLGMYKGLKEGERQFLHGGYINPETGQNEGYSLQAMFESAGKGAILGAATGVISPIFGNVGNKLVGKADRISSTGGSMAAKAGIRATQHLVATGLEGTIFATEGWLTTDEDKVDVWLDSMATMIGFKGHHIIKSAPRVIAGMRPVKPTADRPLTIDERNFNRKSFVERVSAMLDGPKFADERRNGSGMPLSFTKDDISTLKEAGYGSLADIFRSDRAKEADKPFEERVLDALGEDESTAEMSNGSGGLLDGYSEMEKLVKDASVPQEIRAKAYYALTGHCLGAGTITGHATRETDDGRIAVDALTNNGEIVYRRYYKSKDAANAATEKLDRQIELNKIDVGEQYADAVADETILDDVIKAQYPDNNPENIKKIYYGVKYGKARADEHLRKGIDAIDKEIEARKDEAADMRPDAIRKAYGEEYGVDIDDAIRKPSGDRSEAEKRAVESYIARLFASGETRVDRYDSKSDSYVSDVSDVADAADVAETQPETQPIGLATMKFQDGPVEVLSGRVVMTENGKMVDVERSDKTIVVRDPATGKTEMVSPEAMLSYEDVAPEVAADERSMPKYSSGRIVIRDADGKERRGFLTGYVDENGNHEYYVEGDLQHLHYASEHELNNILSEYQPDEPQQPSAEQPQAAERAYPEGVNDTEAYDNGLEDGAASTSMSDEDLNRNIERFSDENEVSSLTDYGRGWIEGLKQEQQRRIQAAQPEQPQQPEPAQAPAEAMQGEVNMPTGVNPVGTISVPQRDGSTRTFTVGKDAEGNNIVVDDRGFMWAHDGNGNAMQPYSPGANVPVWTDEQLSKLGAVQPANEQPATVPNQPENVPTSGETPQNPTENAVSPAESVPNPAAPVENVQETPAPTAEPTPLQRLPRDEKGEPIFEQAETPEIAWDALVEFSDGDVADAKEMADIVTEQKRKALEKLQKQKPKGASLAELRESQKVIKAAREQAEQEYNFWQQMAGVEQLRQEADDRRQAEERAEADRAEAEEKKRKAALDKRLRDTFEDVKDVPEAVEVLEDMDPRDIYEAAAQLLSGQKVLWSDAGVKVGARSETGFGEEERRRLFGLFASEANGGKSLSRLAEDAMKQQCETYGIPYDNQDARNALIDVISGARTVGDIRNYIANNRIDEARRLAEAKRRHEEEQYDEFCRQEYHLSAEEVEAYEDQLLAELSERDREFDANEYNGYIADEMARAAEITKQQKNGTEDNDTRRGSTPGDRRVQENDTEGKGTVPGRGYEVLPESRADQSSGAAADGDRSGIQPADGVQGDGPASAVAQGAQRGDSTVRSQTGGIGLAEARRGVKMVQAEGRTATPQIKLSNEEATDIIAKMEMSAVNDPQISLSPESWQQSFGLSNSIDTPLGKVKMGDGQYQKLIDKKRSAEFGMVVQTLQDPDVVFIEPSEAKEGQTTERNFSYVFVKTFIRDGQKFKYYTSVSVLKDGMEVSVNSHIASKTAIMKKLQDMERAYTKESLLPNSSEWHLAEHPTDVPDLLPTQGKSDVDVETSAKTEPQQPNNAVSSDSSLSTDEQGGTSSIEPNGESTVSDRKDIDFASDKQGGSEKSSADGNDASLKLDAEAKKEAEAKGGLQAVVEAASAEVNTEPTASEPAMDYSAENANFASSYETKDGKRINYTSENPEAYGGLFDFDFSDEVPGAENATEEGRVNRRQQSNPPLQRRNAALLDTNASARLNEANGEYCALERKFRESNYMEFTSTEKVESADDVAFIFEELENASVENVFVVMTKRGVPTVMHISIGGFNWSAMNAAPVKLAYDRIKPDKVYFVHNHPSGALNCSPQDVNCLKQIEGAIGKKTEGVIMDLKSGKYGTFDSSGTGSSASHYKAPAPPVQRRLRLYAFDRHVFNPDYQPSERMSNAEDVAKFLSSHRLGDRSKVSVLVCNNQNQIVANVHTTHTSIDSKGLADDIIRAIGEFGGMHAFLYGDFEQSGMVAYRNLTQAIKERSGGVYNLLDVVRIEGNHTWSARDNGYVYEPGSEYGASLEGDIRFREVEDDAVLNEFAEGKTVKAYRTMQVLDGKLYSPMATKVGGKATPEIKLGVPEQAEEHPEIIKRTKVGRDGVEVGYVVIDKGLGKGTLEVAYNPSIHASLTPLNDQFTSADMRPNLVIVETLIPKSELTSGYRAPMAKDAVGEMSWHSGTVSGKLAKLGKPRRVILSRYDMPVRIVPFKEVAQMIAAQLEGTDIDIPYNVVTPQVRMELRQLGFAISDTPSGSVGENRDFGNAEYITDQEIERINAHQQEMAQTSPEAKRSHAEKLAKKFNTPITIVDDVENLPAAMRNKKGGYDVRSGNVIVVIPNHADVEDVAETVFHEVVAHKGLREMLGEENYDAFCDEIYGHLKDDLKRQVDTEAGRRFMREPEKGYEHHRRVAVDELFGRMAEKGFEDFTKAERGIWAKLKAKVLEAINKFLGSLKLPKWVRLGDNELRYILWRSHERLGARAKAQEQVQNEALDFVDMARDVAKRAELGLNKSDVIVTRSRKTTADRIEESFDAAVAGELTGKPVEIGRLTKEGREYLEKLSGLKLKDVVSFVLNPSDLAHIYRRHFGKNETDARNIPLTKDDIRQMAYVVSSPDKVIFGKEKSGNQRNMFFFLKETDNGSYNLMEVYSDRKGNLTAKSYFKSKEGVSQRAMLLNESSTLTSVTDGATLSDSAKLPKFFESATISEEESFDFRYRDGETGDIWKDQSIGLKEKITYAALRLSKAQADDLTLRNDAMAAIGDNLKNLLHDMRNRRGTTQRFAGADHKVEADIAKAKAAQLRYDRSTVKRVGDLARILMQTGYLSDMTSGEILRLMSAVKNSVGGNDIESSVDKIMDIMIGNQLRNAEDALHSLLSIRGSKVDSRGVEVQGELDVEGQRTIEVVKRTINLNEDDITSLMDDARDRMGDSDKIIADNAAIEYAGLNMALDYAQNIANSKAEETALRYDLKTANEDMKVGRLTENAYKQLVDSIDEAIRKNKIERAEAYFNLVGRLSDSLRESIENAKAFRNAEKARVREIQHNANSDMEGRPSNEHHKDDWKDKMANNGFVQFVLAPLGTFDQILRTFGSKSANGEGYLWNRFMRGWVDCRNKELLGVKNKFARLDEKGAEIFGAFAKTRGDSKKGPKVKSMADMIKLDGKLPTATVKFWDGGEMREHELTQGNLLYIYMVDKMTDGRMKLRRMGITEEDIASVEKALDPRFKEFGDWLQEEFLVDTRNEYNETHKRIFGASMAAVENYFPLKILSNARTDKEEDVNQQGRPDGITTKTGSIIKRRTNSLALDIMGSNALSVVLDHITEMEHWNAYAEWNRDLNTLRTYKRFRNQVMNMTTAYGGGGRLWKRFNDLCLMGAGEYRPPIAMLDKAAVNIAKGVTAAKVSFRIFTALKQLLSAPAYIPEVSTASIAKSLANPYGDFKWCMENLPIFYERWHSRISGDPRLLKTDHDWKTWREGIVAVAARLGMTPNAFVDALTVSIGARAIYQTRLKRYLKEGYGQEEAENRAKQDATILFNQTQQSSESPFLSTMQVDRSWLSVLFTVFRNSSMSYTRQEYDALRNLKRNLTPGQRAKSIEFMTKQILRDWDIDPDTATDAERDQAQSAAKKRFRRQLKKDVVRLATFGFILQLAWNLGAYLPYIIFGDDEDEKDKMWDDALTHAYFGSVEGLTGGDVTSSFGNMWASGEWNDRQLTKDMPLASDISTIINKFVGEKNSEAINDIINLVIQSGTGVNPQSITDVVVAITDACGDDPRLSHEAAICVMRILQVPQSQLDKMYFDEVGLSGREISQYTPGQLAQRYAEYKIMRGTPFVPWMWGDEEQQSKYEKSAQKKIKERLAGREDDEVVATYEDLDDRYKSFTKKIGAVKEMMGTDYIAAAQEAAELQNDPDFKIYQKRNALDAALDKAMRKWPPQRRERVKDLRLESTVAGVPQSKLAIKTSEQKKVSLTGELNRIANKYFTAETPEEARLIADTMAKYRTLIVDAMQTNSEAEQEAAISELSTLIHDFRTKEEEMRSTKR